LDFHTFLWILAPKRARNGGGGYNAMAQPEAGGINPTFATGAEKRLIFARLAL
jgi:hypothetical protein